MGMVMWGFSVASIVGVPLGLFLSSAFNWQAPFLVLGGIGALVWLLAAWVLPPLRGHLSQAGPRASLIAVATEPNHVRAFVFMLSLVGASFLVAPFIASSLVANVGYPEPQLMFIYMAGGVTTLLTLPLLGKITDRVGKLPTFRVMAVFTCVPLLGITVLPAGSGIVLVLVMTTLFFVATSGRMVPGMSLITGSSAPAVRGSFMSLNSAVQQMGAGVATWLGGLLLTKTEQGELAGFPLVGVLACGFSLVSLMLAGRLRPAGRQAPDETLVHEAEGVGAELELAETVGERRAG
jgi:predicted MFS family arabinose efflux permease